MERTIIHSYCQGSTEVPLMYWRSFDRLPTWAETDPDREMIVFRQPDAPRQSITFAEFHRLTDAIAALLIRDHPELTVETRVMLIASNSIDFCLAVAGLHKAGLAVVMGYPFSPNDVRGLVDRANCKAVFYQGSGIYMSVNEWLENRLSVRMELRELVEMGRQLLSNIQVDEALYEKLKQRQSQISADHVAIMYRTSGTTGDPKLVPHSHLSLVNSTRFRAIGALLTSNDIFFSDRPTSHLVGSYGLLMSMLDGIKLIATPTGLVSGDRASTMAAWLCKTFEEEKVSSGDFFGYLVHDILVKGCQLPQSLRSGIIAGALTTELQMERAMEKLPGLVNNYGTTETSSITEILTPWGPNNDPQVRMNTVGGPALHMEILVTDSAVQWSGGSTQCPIPLPLGEVGEVWVRGFSVMRGYVADPDLTRKAITETGWFRTGDLGCMDERGRLTLTGRIKDLIIRAADNIPPGMIERVLIDHPDVHAAQVVGVPDERYGEEIAACIILRESKASSEEVSMARELARWCQSTKLGCVSHTGLTNVPRYWTFVQCFPLGPTGKVTKASIRKLVCSSHCCAIDGLNF